MRLARAELLVGSPNLPHHINLLRARFEAARLRGDRIHQREEAQFTLELLKKPQEALGLARANWLVQKEPADVRILLEAAIAAKDLSVTKEVLAWIKEKKLEDVQLTKISERP